MSEIEPFEFEFKGDNKRYRCIEDGSVIAEGQSITGHWYEHMISDLSPAHRVALKEHGHE